MARFGNKLSAFSITQLSELLEDDEKLSSIVLDLEEVRVYFISFSLRCDFRKRLDATKPRSRVEEKSCVVTFELTSSRVT